MRDHGSEFESLGIQVVGISPDPPQRQADFDRKNSLGFVLLSDPDQQTAAAFGVIRGSLLGRALLGIVRSSFLFDTDGRLIRAWYGVSPSATARLALDAQAGREEST